MWSWLLIVNALIIVMGAVVVIITSMVFVLLEVSLIVTVADLRPVGASALAAVGMDNGLCWGSAVLWVIDLSTQAIHTHTPLGCNLVCPHLKRDGGIVCWHESHLLVEYVSSSTRG